MLRTQTLQTLTALPHETYSVSISAQSPKNATNLATHEWKLSIVNLSKKDNASSAETVVDLESGSVAIVSSAQMTYWEAYESYSQNTTAYSAILSSAFSSPNNYEFSQSAAYVAEASSEATLAEQQYAIGNFAPASSDMTKAMNDYQLAITSYESTAQSLSSSQSNFTSSQSGYYSAEVKYLVSQLNYTTSEVKLLTSEVSNLPIISAGIVILGVGVLIIGVGVLIRSFRGGS
jgi:hypothetical protein